MKVALMFLAIIGLINASPVAKPRAPATTRIDAALTSGSVLTMSCAPAGYTITITAPVGAAHEETTVAVGAGNDLALNEDVPLACRQAVLSTTQGQTVFAFNLRGYNECGGNMVTVGENAEFTIDASVFESVAVDGQLFNDMKFSNVQTTCTFSLDDPDAADGNTIAEAIPDAATGESTLSFSLSPVAIRAANRFSFTLQPEGGVQFPDLFSYNLVSCRSRRNADPLSDTEEYQFLSSAGVCGRGVAITETANEVGQRQFDISLPAHRFPGQTGVFQNAVVIDCNVRLCREDQDGCLAVTCPAGPPPPPPPEPTEAPVTEAPVTDEVIPVDETVRAKRIPVSPRKAVPKANLAPAVKSGKVTIVQ